MVTTETSWTRRDFLKHAGTALGALGLSPLFPDRGAQLSAGRPSAPPHLTGDAGADLPPQVVGLRTLGGDFRFDPPGLGVEPGTRLTWLNMGDFHTTTAFHPDNDGLLADRVPLRIPEEAEPWHSGMLGLTGGSDYSYTFDVPGVYDYFCQPHYSFGMVGRVIAGEPRGGPAVTRPLSELNDASQEQMPAVETILGRAGRTYEWASRLNGLMLLASNEGDVAAAAEAVGGGIEDDAKLQEVASATGATDRLRSRVAGVVKGARDGVGYEELLGRVDAAKDVLTALR